MVHYENFTTLADMAQPFSIPGEEPIASPIVRERSHEARLGTQKAISAPVLVREMPAVAYSVG